MLPRHGKARQNTSKLQPGRKFLGLRCTVKQMKHPVITKIYHFIIPWGIAGEITGIIAESMLIPSNDIREESIIRRLIRIRFPTNGRTKFVWAVVMSFFKEMSYIKMMPCLFRLHEAKWSLYVSANYAFYSWCQTITGTCDPLNHEQQFSMKYQLKQFFKEHFFENIVCKILAILFRHQHDNSQCTPNHVQHCSCWLTTQIG